MKQTTFNKELQDKLETRYEYHGFNGEKVHKGTYNV